MTELPPEAAAALEEAADAGSMDGAAEGQAAAVGSAAKAWLAQRFKGGRNGKSSTTGDACGEAGALGALVARATIRWLREPQAASSWGVSTAAAANVPPSIIGSGRNVFFPQLAFGGLQLLFCGDFHQVRLYVYSLAQA